MRAVGGAIAIVLAAVALAFLWKLASERPASRLSTEDVARSVRALAAYSKETAFFVEHLESGDLTAAFAQTHRDKLEEIVAAEMKALEGPIPPPLAGTAARARELGGSLAAALKDLPKRFADRDALRRIRDESARAGAELARLVPPK